MPPKRRDTRSRFEQWVKNPKCQANTISAVKGIAMSKIAQGQGVDQLLKPSPFALQRGNEFEKYLFAKNADVILKEFKKHGIFEDISKVQFKDMRLKMHHHPPLC